MKINNPDLLHCESHLATNPGSRSGGAQNRKFADALRPTGSPAEEPAAPQTPAVQDRPVAEGPMPALLAKAARGADVSAAGQRQDAALEAARSLTR